MKILDLRVDWMFGWANDPGIELLVDHIPEQSEMVFQYHEPGLWFAEKDGHVRYFSWAGPGNEGGFGDREFLIRVYKGPMVFRITGKEETEEVVLKGPWSSRASVMNGVGLWPMCTEVALTDEPKTWKRGFTYLAGNVTIELLEPELAKRGLIIRKGIDREPGKFPEVRFKLDKPLQCEHRDMINGKKMWLGKDQDYRCRLPLGHKGEHKW